MNNARNSLNGLVLMSSTSQTSKLDPVEMMAHKLNGLKSKTRQSGSNKGRPPDPYNIKDPFETLAPNRTVFSFSQTRGVDWENNEGDEESASAYGDLGGLR